MWKIILSILFCYLMLDFYAKTRIGFSPWDKRLFEITEVEITRVDYSFILSFSLWCASYAIRIAHPGFYGLPGDV